MERPRERRYTADHVERLRSRLRESEARNQALMEDLGQARAAANAAVQVPSSPAATEARDQTQERIVDAASEVTYLSISAAGERQPYLGSTSGVVFASLINPTERSAASAASVVSNHSPNDLVSPSAPRARTSGEPRKVEELPSREVAERLLIAFFGHDHIAYPFLQPQVLLDLLDRFYGDEDYYALRATAHEVFIFNMVLAVASAHVSKFAWQTLPSADSHQGRAFKEINTVLSHSCVETLQCLILVCLWRTSSSVSDNSASMWHTVGVAVRIALELGLHRETAYPSKPAINDCVASADYVQQEVARRCFWCVVAMDRITSNILGRPLGIAFDDIDTALPLAASDAPLNIPLTPTVNGVPRYAIFNQIIEYRMFCGRAITRLHRKRPANMSLESALMVREALAHELDEWYRDTRKLRIPSTNETESSEHSCFLRPIWYEVIYANAKLMIWRPCPLLADLANDRHSLQRIHDSSLHAIKAYAQVSMINYIAKKLLPGVISCPDQTLYLATRLRGKYVLYDGSADQLSQAPP